MGFPLYQFSKINGTRSLEEIQDCINNGFPITEEEWEYYQENEDDLLLIEQNVNIQHEEIFSEHYYTYSEAKKMVVYDQKKLEEKVVIVEPDISEELAEYEILNFEFGQDGIAIIQAASFRTAFKYANEKNYRLGKAGTWKWKRPSGRIFVSNENTTGVFHAEKALNITEISLIKDGMVLFKESFPRDEEEYSFSKIPTINPGEYTIQVNSSHRSFEDEIKFEKKGNLILNITDNQSLLSVIPKQTNLQEVQEPKKKKQKKSNPFNDPRTKSDADLRVLAINIYRLVKIEEVDDDVLLNAIPSSLSNSDREKLYHIYKDLYGWHLINHIYSALIPQWKSDANYIELIKGLKKVDFQRKNRNKLKAVTHKKDTGKTNENPIYPLVNNLDTQNDYELISNNEGTATKGQSLTYTFDAPLFFNDLSYLPGGDDLKSVQARNDYHMSYERRAKKITPRLYFWFVMDPKGDLIVRQWLGYQKDEHHKVTFEAELEGEYTVFALVKRGSGYLHLMESTVKVINPDKVAEEGYKEVKTQNSSEFHTGLIDQKAELEVAVNGVKKPYKDFNSSSKIKSSGGNVIKKYDRYDEIKSSYTVTSNKNAKYFTWEYSSTYPDAFNAANKINWYGHNWRIPPYSDTKLIKKDNVIGRFHIEKTTKKSVNLNLPSLPIGEGVPDVPYLIECKQYNANNEYIESAYFFQWVRDAKGKVYKANAQSLKSTDHTLSKFKEFSPLIDGEMTPLEAVYVNKGVGKSIPLSLYYGKSKENSNKIVLLDFTQNVTKTDFDGDNLKDAVDDFQGWSAYPDGWIYIKDPETGDELGPFEADGETVIESLTDWTTWLAGLSYLGAIGTAFIPGAQGASVYLLGLGTVLAAANAGLSIYDNLDRDEFSTERLVLDIADLASTIISAGRIKIGSVGSNLLKTGLSLKTLPKGWVVTEAIIDGGTALYMTTQSLEELNAAFDLKDEGERQNRILLAITKLTLSGGMMMVNVKDLNSGISTRKQTKIDAQEKANRLNKNNDDVHGEFIAHGVRHSDELLEAMSETVRGVSRREFYSSVPEFAHRSDLAEKAFNLWKKEDWKGLEDFINKNNLNWGWPPNRGFVDIEIVTLEIEITVFDRYGGRVNKGKFSDRGAFVAPIHVKFENRALPKKIKDNPYRKYKVIKPIPNVKKGLAIPWFNMPGKGIQYELPMSIDELIKRKYITTID